MEDLLAFLSVPLSDGSLIFERFAQLPNAIYHCGSEKLQRFVYIPGTRKDSVVLIAHTDTVWDDAYTHSELNARFETDPQTNVIHSVQEGVGIGADDRAGCAMLWKLRNSGHSLLLLDGEEHGHHGAVFLRKEHKDILRALNRHRYMVQLDLWSSGFCMYHGIPNSRKFCNYIEQSLHLQPLDKKAGTDVGYLCKSACGVNISVGYRQHHTAKEFLDIAVWEQIYKELEAFLAKPQPKFRILLYRRIRRLAGRVFQKIKRILKRSK